MIEIQYHRGLYLPRQALWLDPREAKPLAFVSHAHSDHMARHAEIITSAGTARLMQARLPGKRTEHLLEFEVPSRVRDLQVTLLAAGHIFGSAQFFLQTDAGSLLYTGDFKLRPSLSAEATQWCHAETLVMETTYGLPKYQMPPTGLVLSQIVNFCRDALEEKAVPVLLGYSLGKSQEILCALIGAGLTPMLHTAVHQMTEIYRELRPDFPGGYMQYDAAQVAGKVLICPPNAQRSMVAGIPNRRTAIITGWALDPGATFRYQVDAAFPLTDHADYPDLLRYVELVQPKRVLTLHGFASAFASDLRALGIEAWALTEENQLELALHRPQSSLPKAPTQNPPQFSEPQFLQLVNLHASIASSPGKLKVQRLSQFFKSLEKEALGVASSLLMGHALAQPGERPLRIKWPLLKRALLASCPNHQPRFQEIAQIHREPGAITYEFLVNRTGTGTCSLLEIQAFFNQLHPAQHTVAGLELLRLQFLKLSAIEASHLVKLLTADPKIRLAGILVEAALLAAFGSETKLPKLEPLPAKRPNPDLTDQLNLSS